MDEFRQIEIGTTRLGETYLGGFASGFLARGLHIGYGLYFSTARLFGIEVGTHSTGALGGLMAGMVESQLMPNLSSEESASVIGLLERIKEFDIRKDQIQRIEVKKPGMLTPGHVTIIQNDGSSVKITLRHKVAYDRIVQLTQAFGPDMVSLS